MAICWHTIIAVAVQCYAMQTLQLPLLFLFGSYHGHGHGSYALNSELSDYKDQMFEATSIAKSAACHSTLVLSQKDLADLDQMSNVETEAWWTS